MNKVYENTKGNRKVEIFEKLGGEYEVYCLIGENISRSFPSKSYVNYKAAVKYANKFMG